MEEPLWLCRLLPPERETQQSRAMVERSRKLSHRGQKGRGQDVRERATAGCSESACEPEGAASCGSGVARGGHGGDQRES